MIRIETIESFERHVFINVLHQFYRWGVKQEICVTLITLLHYLISQVHQSFPKTTFTSGQVQHENSINLPYLIMFAWENWD